MILVTGASGHLGAALVREVQARGRPARALVRETSDRRGIEGLEVEVVTGDLLDPDSLQQAMEGCTHVLHAAAVHRNWVADPQEFLRPAVEGTENVLRAAKTAEVERVVLVSSNAAVGYGTDLAQPLDESSWNADPRAAYIRAKTESERHGLELGRELGVEVVSVCPCGIIGPWDYRLTPTTRSVQSVARGGPSVLDVALTDVRDVAHGTWLAALKGMPGERYLLSGQNCTKEELAGMVSELTGVPAKAMLPPRFVMWILAFVGETRARYFGGPDPDLTRDALHDVYGRHLLYDSRKAREQLGWEPRPAEEALTDALRWLLFIGAIAPTAKLQALDPWPAEGSA